MITDIILVIGRSENLANLHQVQDNSKLVPYSGKSFKIRVFNTEKTVKTKEKVTVIEALDLEALKPHKI